MPHPTEKLDDEDWCPECQTDVMEWEFIVEEDSDGDVKIYMCPHCGAKCGRNGFLISLVGMIVCLGAVLLAFELITFPQDLDSTAGVFFGFTLFCLIAVLSERLVSRLHKKFRYRHRHSDRV